MKALDQLLMELASGDDDRAEAAIPEIAAYGAAALDSLRILISQSVGPAGADMRWWAIRGLAELGKGPAVILLVASLDDPDDGVRECAALGLRKAADPDTIPALIKTLNDPDLLCATLAADTLAVIGSPAVPALLEVMQNGTHSARLEAMRALALIKDTRAIPAMFAALDSDSALMEYWANEGLERLGVGMTFFKPG